MNLTTFLENKLVDHILRNTPYTPPTAVYVALHTANPTESGEVGESTLDRKEVTFSAPSGGATTNAADLVWDIDTTVKPTHLTICDAASDGNRLFYGPLLDPKTGNPLDKTLEDGEEFKIAANAIELEFD